jgi:hypothetical protein
MPYAYGFLPYSHPGVNRGFLRHTQTSGSMRFTVVIPARRHCVSSRAPTMVKAETVFAELKKRVNAEMVKKVIRLSPARASEGELRGPVHRRAIWLHLLAAGRTPVTPPAPARHVRHAADACARTNVPQVQVVYRFDLSERARTAPRVRRVLPALPGRVAACRAGGVGDPAVCAFRGGCGRCAGALLTVQRACVPVCSGRRQEVQLARRPQERRRRRQGQPNSGGGARCHA